MKFFILTILTMFASISMASETKVITCTYNYGNEEVVFGTGVIKKSLSTESSVNGLKYKYHIENIDKLNEIDDYVVVENEKGHRVTFSLNCK